MKEEPVTFTTCRMCPLQSFKLDTHALQTKQWAAQKSLEWHVFLPGSSAPDNADVCGLVVGQLGVSYHSNPE